MVSTLFNALTGRHGEASGFTVAARREHQIGYARSPSL